LAVARIRLSTNLHCASHKTPGFTKFYFKMNYVLHAQRQKRENTFEPKYGPNW
jgi:hypothetical protein